MIAPALLLALHATGTPPATPPSGQAPSRGLVVVISPAAEDELTRNAMARITGELAAAPFQVEMTPANPSADIMTEVESVGRDRLPVAAFAIVREGGERPGTVAVWVSNRITETTTVHRVMVRGGDVDGAAAHLAVEAVEFVRASLAGLWPSPRKPAPPEPPPPPPPPPSRHLAVGVGVGLFKDFGTAPMFWEPSLTASLGVADELALRLRLVGLGPSTEAETSAGLGARLQRAAATLGLVLGFRSGRTVQPLLSAALGAHYLAADGMGATNPGLEHDVSYWSGLATLGGGVAITLAPHVALTAEVEGMLIWPAVSVRVSDAEVVRIDRPILFSDLGLLATF
jgi:hypothetical protein